MLGNDAALLGSALTTAARAARGTQAGLGLREQAEGLEPLFAAAMER